MDDTGPALQDVLKVHCFGCGALNAHGLQIKSRWDGDELVCHWRPPPQYIGYPGVVYGGAIASVVDCHAIWTAMAHYCREQGIAIDATAVPAPPAFVTGQLVVNYLRPAAIDQSLQLRAKVLAQNGRRSTVSCRVMQGDVECATAEVVAVRMKEQ
jgi:acyl-coenzyme A thioesterase PaaI-like protein